MAQADSSTLSVVVTSKRTRFLTKVESERICCDIERVIISEAREKELIGPAFTAQPLFEDSVLKFWCDSEHTLNWLKRTVSRILIPTNEFVVKSQSDIQKRTCCFLTFSDKHDVFHGTADIKDALCYQNVWIDFHDMEIVSSVKYDNDWSVKFTFAEEQIRALMKAGRRLSIGLKLVNVMFVDPNGREIKVPRGWNTATETFDSPKKS